MIRLHARVTKEVEITDEQAERIVNHLCGCAENAGIDDIVAMFTDDVNSGDYEKGYIPYEWLRQDLISQLKGTALEYLESNEASGRKEDIDL